MSFDLSSLPDLVRFGAFLLVAMLALGLLRFVLKVASKIIGLAFVAILVIVVILFLNGAIHF